MTKFITIFSICFFLHQSVTAHEVTSGGDHKHTAHPFGKKMTYGVGCLFLDMYSKLFDYVSRVEFYKVETHSETEDKCFFRTVAVLTDKSEDNDEEVGEFVIVPKSYELGGALKKKRDIYRKISKKGDVNNVRESISIRRVLAVNFSNYVTKEIKRVELLDASLLYKFEDMRSPYIDDSYKKFNELYGEKDPYTLFFKSLVNDKYTNFEKRVGEINFQGYIGLVHQFGEDVFKKHMTKTKRVKIADIVLKRYKEMKENGTLEDFLKRSHAIK